jgi:glucose/arabinose dehydrogenase
VPVRDSWQDFVGGFGPKEDPKDGPLKRPSDVTFSKDGRLFFADDIGGHVFFVARE